MSIQSRLVVFIFLLASAVADSSASTFNREVLDIKDINPDPDVFEASLVATEQTVMIDGQPVLAMFYRDENNAGAYSPVPDGIPVPQIIVDVGEEVIVHFRNGLAADCSAVACNSSIHWHGIELDNDSDGTGVTQNRVEPGESYTYRFIAPRAGIFWFHPHMLPGPQTFAGMYGAFIVRDPREDDLQAAGVIPGDASTHTVVLSDIEFDDDPDSGQAAQVGYNVEGELRTWAELKEHCEAVPPTSESQLACRTVQDGRYPLVNGQYTGMPNDAVGMLARRGEGLRLRLINTSTNRYYRLKLFDNGNDNNLYRIGGEGGFLEFVRREGGVLGQWDTRYERGELVIPASGRADVVLVPNPPADDVDGTIILYGEGYERGGPADLNHAAMKPAEDLIFIVVDEPMIATPFQIADGDPILGAGAIDDLKSIDESELDALLDQPDMPGTTDSEIRLEVLDTGRMAINGVRGSFEDSGGDYRAVPFQGASRYAKTGDVLELTVKNCGNNGDCVVSGQNHPFHLHGFSFQPVRIIDNESGDVLYEYDYNEFQDVIDVFKGQSVVFRTRLDDRPIITDNRQEFDAPPPDQYFPGGGAQGRWVYHCHLFLHAALGMISELVVVPTPVAVCEDQTVDTAPGFCAAGPLSIDGGSFHPNGEFFSLLQDPSSGVFQLGETTATLTATGADGLSTSCESIVTVVDNELPTITAPADVVDECDATGGSALVDLGAPTTDDNCGQNFTMNFGPSFYPLGNTVVKWQTSDGNGNSAIASQLVTVVDRKKPDLTVPDDIGPVECTTFTGETIDIGAATATDVCDADVAISKDAPALFPVGTTTVHWTAKDDSLNSSSGLQEVTVADTAAPVVYCNAAEKIAPSEVVQSFASTATDTCDSDVVPEAFEYVCYSFTRNGMRVDRTEDCDVAFRGEIVDIINSAGVGSFVEWTLLALDDSGNSTTHTCTVEVVRKKDL